MQSKPRLIENFGETDPDIRILEEKLRRIAKEEQEEIIFTALIIEDDYPANSPYDDDLAQQFQNLESQTVHLAFDWSTRDRPEFVLRNDFVEESKAPTSLDTEESKLNPLFEDSEPKSKGFLLAARPAEEKTERTVRRGGQFIARPQKNLPEEKEKEPALPPRRILQRSPLEGGDRVITPPTQSSESQHTTGSGSDSADANQPELSPKPSSLDNRIEPPSSPTHRSPPSSWHTKPVFIERRDVLGSSGEHPLSNSPSKPSLLDNKPNQSRETDKPVSQEYQKLRDTHAERLPAPIITKRESNTKTNAPIIRGSGATSGNSSYPRTPVYAHVNPFYEERPKDSTPIPTLCHEPASPGNGHADNVVTRSPQPEPARSSHSESTANRPSQSDVAGARAKALLLPLTQTQTCYACSSSIESPAQNFIRFGGLAFHTNHFHCFLCQEALSTSVVLFVTVLNGANGPCCQKCHYGRLG